MPVWCGGPKAKPPGSVNSSLHLSQAIFSTSGSPSEPGDGDIPHAWPAPFLASCSSRSFACNPALEVGIGDGRDDLRLRRQLVSEDQADDRHGAPIM